jgi:hypothetical protein
MNMVTYLALLHSQPASFTESGRYYFDLFADSEKELERIVKEWELNGKLKITTIKEWQIRSDPKGFLEDYDKVSGYVKRLNAGTISEKDLPNEFPNQLSF